jgi:hypothetical protein
MVVGHEGVWVMSRFLGKREERHCKEGEESKGKKNFLPLPLRVKGRRRCTMQFKTSFFFYI